MLPRAHVPSPTSHDATIAAGAETSSATHTLPASSRSTKTLPSTRLDTTAALASSAGPSTRGGRSRGAHGLGAGAAVALEVSVEAGAKMAMKACQRHQ